jgi:hypothetical protein
VILELDGAVAQPPVSPVVGRALPIASAILAAATLLMSSGFYGPHTPNASTRTSVLEEALTRQSSTSATLALRLPPDVATEIRTRDVDGVTGPARSAPTFRSFRLSESDGVVIVAMLPGAPAIVSPSNPPADALSVRGTYAANYSVEAMSLSALRWTENGMTYEVASRTVLLRDLAALAEQVR